MEVNNLAGMGITQARQGTPVKPEFDGSNVNDQLASTLNQGGLLMRMAQSKGQGLASQRGLGNSTIGIDAAQRAMVDAALPIAQQNAQQSNQRGLQDDAQSFSAGQADLDRKQQLTMQGNDFNNQMALNNQQNSWNSAEAQKDRLQQLAVLEKQFGQETAQMAQQVVANTHGMYMGAIDSAMNSYNERYAALIADSNITATDKTNLANNMKTELNSTLNMYQKLYSNISTIRPDWSQFPTISLPGVSLG